MAAIAEAGVAVKSGAGQDRAGCSRTGQPGNDALEQHEGPGEQVASIGGWRPRTSTGPSDQGERSDLRSFSKGFAVPIEDDYICGTVALYRLEDGRLLARRLDCRQKGCPKCGPRLRASWARLWAQVMAGETIYRWVGPDLECAKLLRRKVMAGHQYGVIPLADGLRAVFTTAAIGDLVQDLEGALEVNFRALPDGVGRQRSLSRLWQKRADAVEAFAGQAPAGKPKQKVEFVGILRQGLEHARQLAREFGVYEEEAGIDGSAFIMRQPDNQTDWKRFRRWAGLEEPGRRTGRRRRVAA